MIVYNNAKKKEKKKKEEEVEEEEEYKNIKITKEKIMERCQEKNDHTNFLLVDDASSDHNALRDSLGHKTSAPIQLEAQCVSITYSTKKMADQHLKKMKVL